MGRIAIALLCTLHTVTALAQADDARWFKVELLIFSQGDPAASSELWPPEPSLDYPDDYRFIRDLAAEEKHRESRPDAQESIDERGIQTLTLPVPVTEGERAEIADADIPLRESAADASNALPQAPNTAATDIASTVSNAETETPLRPTPWIRQPSGDLEFRGKAAYMQRTGKYQILFHESWVQPMSGENDSASIIVDRSGDNQNWPRLQGSVKVYLSRYLHIATDLWLNTVGEYIDADWTMPAPPWSPQSLVLVEPQPASDTLGGNSLPGTGFNVTSPYPAVDQSSALAVEEQVPTDSMTGSAELSGEEAAAEQPIYPWRHAIRLKDRRRMRSNEVHYLDHPLMGVVIKLTPMRDEELESMALAEAQAMAARTEAGQLLTLER